MANTNGNTTLTTPSDREMVMTRVFNAPRQLVYDAYTDPKHVPNWWGPREVTTRVDEMDVRPGGKWRYVQVTPEGAEYGFRGEYQEVTPPERLVYTFEFEGMPGHVVVETLTLEELDGKTKITATSVFQTPEDLQGMLATGAEAGAIETWNRLEELLATLS